MMRWMDVNEAKPLLLLLRCWPSLGSIILSNRLHKSSRIARENCDISTDAGKSRLAGDCQIKDNDVCSYSGSKESNSPAFKTAKRKSSLKTTMEWSKELRGLLGHATRFKSSHSLRRRVERLLVAHLGFFFSCFHFLSAARGAPVCASAAAVARVHVPSVEECGEEKYFYV